MVKRYDEYDTTTHPCIESSDGEYVLFANYDKLEAENQYLKARLNEAEKNIEQLHNRLLDEILNKQEVEKRNAEALRHKNMLNAALNTPNEAEAELERLRASVPEDVERKLNELCEVMFKAGVDAEIKDFDLVVRDNFKALIGSLIERKREDLEDAWIDGWSRSSTLIDRPIADDRAQAYAERKMKEGNG